MEKKAEEYRLQCDEAVKTARSALDSAEQERMQARRGREMPRRAARGAPEVAPCALRVALSVHSAEASGGWRELGVA